MNNLRKLRYRRVILRWHRWLGIASAGFVVILLATGIVLNHNATLKLDEIPIASPSLLAWYGLAPKSDPVAFQAAETSIIWLEGSIFLDDQLIDEGAPPIVGVVRASENYLIATGAWLRLFSPFGERLQQIAETAFENGITALGYTASGSVAVKNRSGRTLTSPDLQHWVPSSDDITWSRPQPIVKEQLRHLLEAYRGPGLPLGRILLDFHSGRILGWWGPYLMDVAALFLLLVIISGFYNWLANKR